MIDRTKLTANSKSQVPTLIAGNRSRVHIRLQGPSTCAIDMCHRHVPDKAGIVVPMLYLPLHNRFPMVLAKATADFSPIGVASVPECGIPTVNCGRKADTGLAAANDLAAVPERRRADAGVAPSQTWTQTGAQTGAKNRSDRARPASGIDASRIGKSGKNRHINGTAPKETHNAHYQPHRRFS